MDGAHGIGVIRGGIAVGDERGKLRSSREIGYIGLTFDRPVDAVIYALKSPENGRALIAALRGLGFTLDSTQEAEIERGKDFVQLKNGPFNLDLVFAPDGIDEFDKAWQRHIEANGFPVCHPDDIIASKAAANRVKDRESLPRLRSFRDYWMKLNHP